MMSLSSITYIAAIINFHNNTPTVGTSFILQVHTDTVYNNTVVWCEWMSVCVWWVSAWVFFEAEWGRLPLLLCSLPTWLAGFSDIRYRMFLPLSGWEGEVDGMKVRMVACFVERRWMEARKEEGRHSHAGRKRHSLSTLFSIFTNYIHLLYFLCLLYLSKNWENIPLKSYPSFLLARYVGYRK